MIVSYMLPHFPQVVNRYFVETDVKKLSDLTENPSYFPFSSTRRILPEMVLGNSFTNSTTLGYL